MGKGKLFKAAATIAAIGGVCYVFRDKIKNSTVYQSLDMDDKVEKVKHTIKEKIISLWMMLSIIPIQTLKLLL